MIHRIEAVFQTGGTATLKVYRCKGTTETLLKDLSGDIASDAYNGDVDDWGGPLAGFPGEELVVYMTNTSAGAAESLTVYSSSIGQSFRQAGRANRKQ